MDLGNLVETIVHYILIGEWIVMAFGMGFPMVSVLVCTVTHWIRLTVSHDIRLSGSHKFTKLLCRIISQP